MIIPHIINNYTFCIIFYYLFRYSFKNSLFFLLINRIFLLINKKDQLLYSNQSSILSKNIPLKAFVSFSLQFGRVTYSITLHQGAALFYLPLYYNYSL